MSTSTRVAVLAVGVVALALGLIHGTQRAWAYEDEQQHVDLALKLAQGRFAHIEDLIEPSLVRSTLETGRPSRAADITNDDPATWGLEGRSYMGFHPPLAPALLAPVARLTGGDAYATMRAGRVLAAVLVAASTMLVAGLAARWRPEQPAVAAAMAGLAFGTLPVVSDLGGRWSNDVVALALTLAAITQACRIADTAPAGVSVRSRELVVLAVLLAGAISAKATGGAAVIAAAAIAGPAVVRSRGWGPAVAVLAAPAVAAGAWLLVIRTRYGTFDGSAAFRDAYGSYFPSVSLLSSPFDPHSGARAQLHQSLLPLLNADWGLPGWVPLAVAGAFLAGVVAVAIERRWQPLVALAGVALPSLVLLEVVLREGHNTPSGRFVVSILAVGAAVAAGSWARWSPVGWAAPLLCTGVGIWFVVEHRPLWW